MNICAIANPCFSNSALLKFTFHDIPNPNSDSFLTGIYIKEPEGYQGPQADRLAVFPSLNRADRIGVEWSLDIG